MSAPVLTKEDIQKLLAEPDTRVAWSRFRWFKARRDKAVLLLLFETGVCRDEVRHLRVEDIDFDAKTIRVTRPRGVFNKRSKGVEKKERTLPLSERLLEVLAWLCKGRTEGYLLTSCRRTGRTALGRRTINTILEDCSKRAGLANRVKPDDLRRANHA